MHNCRLTKSLLLDYALGELPATQTNQLLGELNDCAACQAEYSSIKHTLQVSERALGSTAPAEDFWPGYHARLQSKLAQQVVATQASPSAAPALQSFSSRVLGGLRAIATTSIRVPVPAALAIMLLAGMLFFFVRPREVASINQLPQAPVVETRTVQVPVIQEKVVTQIVYVEKKARRTKGGSGPINSFALDPQNAMARAGTDPSSKKAMSLVGFKPTEQVKLTVIKGSYQDEK